MLYNSIEEKVGNTPVTYWGTYKEARLWIKEEGVNPSGSLKDRTAAAIVRDAISKDTPKSKRFLDASSGSFACALGLFSVIQGYGTTVVVNSKISEDNLTFLDMLGVELIHYGTVTGEGREYCMKLIDEEPEKWYFTDQLTTPLAPQVHAKTTAPEIFKELPDVTAVVASKGSGATLCGISRYIAENDRTTKVFGSVAVEGDEKKIAGTYMHGVDFISPFIEELDYTDAYTKDQPVSYKDAMENSKKLLQKGILAGPQGGGVFTAAIKAIDEEGLSGDVVLIAGDTLLKNISRFVKNR